MANLAGVVLKTLEYNDIKGIVFEVGDRSQFEAATPVLEDVTLPNREDLVVDVFPGEIQEESWPNFDTKKVFHVSGDIYAAVDAPFLAIVTATALWQTMGSEKQKELLIKHGIISKQEAVTV